MVLGRPFIRSPAPCHVPVPEEHYPQALFQGLRENGLSMPLLVNLPSPQGHSGPGGGQREPRAPLLIGCSKPSVCFRTLPLLLHTLMVGSPTCQLPASRTGCLPIFPPFCPEHSLSY